MHAALVVAQTDADDVDTPARGYPDVGPRAAEHQQVVGRCDRADRAQRREGSPVAAVRCRGEQEHVGSRCRQLVNRALTIGVAADAVRFVHDDEIPPARNGGRQHLRPFDVVDRRDRRGQRGPRIDADRQLGGESTETASIDAGCVDAEPFLQLTRPLLAKAGGRDHENPLDRAARAQLRHDQPRLNRLAEADLVGEQYAGAHAAQNGKGRLELKRHHLDVCVSG